METFKTDLGIEYDVEIIEVGLKSVVIRATCEEGAEEFTITFPYEIKEDDAFYGQVLDGDCSQITEDDLTDANSWVNEITVGFVAKEIAMWCVRKSDDSFYWSFDVPRHIRLSAGVYKHDRNNGMEITESHYLHGEDEIKDFLFYNK